MKKEKTLNIAILTPQELGSNDLAIASKALACVVRQALAQTKNLNGKAREGIVLYTVVTLLAEHQPNLSQAQHADLIVRTQETHFSD